MKVDKERSTLKTFGGSACSLFLIIILLVYTVQKTNVLVSRKNVDILSTLEDLHYSDEDIFSYQNGFNVAVGLTAFNSETEWVLDPTVGKLDFYAYGWREKDGNFVTEERQLPSHVCTHE